MAKKSIGVTSLMHCLILHHSWKIWDQILKLKRKGKPNGYFAWQATSAFVGEDSWVGEMRTQSQPGWESNSEIFQIGQPDIGASFEAISDSWTNEWLRRNGLPHHKIFLNFSSRRNNFSTGGCTISYKQRHQWYDYFSNPMTSVTQMFSKRPSQWQISYFRDRFCTILNLNRSLDVVVIRFEGILRRR